MFDDLAGVHDTGSIRHLPNDAKVVGDEQHGHVEFLLQLFEQLQDLGLDGHVEGRCRLVGNQKVGFVGEGHGDHHALALAARELVRIGGEALLGIADADFVQQVDDTFAGGAIRKPAVQFEDFTDLSLDGVQRIERGHGFLEDHGYGVAANTSQLAVFHGHRILVLEQDLS